MNNPQFVPAMVNDTEALWIHECGSVEWAAPSWQPEDGSCDGCEGTNSDPSLWRLLYARVETPDESATQSRSPEVPGE